MQMNNMPVGWSFKRVQDMGRVITGSTPPMSDAENYGGDFCWATAQDFKSKYIKNTVVKLSNKGKGVARVLPAGSVLITCIASIGLNAIAQTEMATNQQINAIVPNSNFDSEFLYYLFCYNTDKLKQYAGGGGILILSKGEFEKMRFMVPAFAEQKKIAEILGTWDRAIEELTDLIAEKKELKRGLMQRLLTGTQRLPGFTKPWKKVKINTFLREISEKTTLNNQHKVLSVTKNGVCSQEDYFEKQIASENNIGYKILRKHNLVFSPMNLWMGSLGFSDYDIGIVSPAYKIFIVDESVTDYRFLKYFMITPQMIYVYKVNSEIGASIVRRNLDLDGLLSSFVHVPEFEEQKAIADVLSKADAEIDLLNQRLDVLKEQKRGLMQKLLTGEIRVKVDME